jgi:hypothetical protein
VPRVYVVNRSDVREAKRDSATCRAGRPVRSEVLW